MDAGPSGTLLERVAVCIAGEIGDAFLRKLVATLRGTMEADFVMITLGEGTPPSRARAIYALEDDASVALTYDLEGTPCHLVYRGQELLIPAALEARFPVEAGFQSYAGVPIRDGAGVRGHLAVLSARPVDAPATVMSVLRIFALRVEAELRRMALEAERERLIGDLRGLNARLGAAHRTAREESAFKTRLLGIIAHDLRNPLAAILSQAELAEALALRGEVERMVRAVGKIGATAERMSGLITATLDRVRDDQRNLELHRTAVDLGALVRMATEPLRETAARKSITLTLETPDGVMAEVDEALMLQAVDNLLTNALKYTHPGGSVRACVTRAGDEARIAVADDGQGLSETDLARAFGRFETLSAKPTAGETATGLGLANVREIVDRHGGRVGAESAGRGRGATFTIAVPLPVPAHAQS